MRIRALEAFTIRDAETGKLTSIAYGGVAEFSNAIASQLITDGLAEEYTTLSPTGTKDIIRNDEGIDVAEYAKVNVNVPTSGGGSDVSVITIPVTHIVPDGSVFQNAYCDLHVILNNTDYKTADGAMIDDNLYAVVVGGYCKMDNMTCNVDSGYCIPSNVTTTGGITWDANTASATIIGEGTMTITWEFAD